MNKSDVIETWYQRVWVEGDLDAIDELFEPDTVANGLVKDVQVGPEEFKVLVSAMLQLVRDLSVSVDKYIESGNWISALITLNSTSIANAAPAEIHGQVFLRIIDGKIVEAYNHFDFLDFFAQLDLLPKDTFELCLIGEGLT